VVLVKPKVLGCTWCRNIGVTYEASTEPFPVVGAKQKFGAPQEKNMENLAIVVVFALTLVAIVALGRGIRGKLGGIEIATQQDSISRSKKNPR
jgi:hypothetical protein